MPRFLGQKFGVVPWISMYMLYSSHTATGEPPPSPGWPVEPVEPLEPPTGRILTGKILRPPILSVISSSEATQQRSTWSHKKKFNETVVPLPRLFLMLSMMPQNRCTAKENKLIALLRNEDWIVFVMSIVVGPCHSGCLTLAAFNCCRKMSGTYLIFTSCNINFLFVY